MKQVFELKLELGSCNSAWACFSVWIVFFSPLRHQTLHWSWWGLQRITEQVGLYPEARGPPVGTSSHDVFNTNTVARGSLPSVSPLSGLDSHAFHYRVHRRSEHMKRQSIFLFSSRSKKRFCLCAFQHARFCISGSSSVITAWCIVPGLFEGLLSIAMRSS